MATWASEKFSFHQVSVMAAAKTGTGDVLSISLKNSSFHRQSLEAAGVRLRVLSTTSLDTVSLYPRKTTPCSLGLSPGCPSVAESFSV